MKTALTYLMATIMLGLAHGCGNNDDDGDDPVDRLPEATQIGAGTLGCLIDGEVYLPDLLGNNRPDAFYSFGNDAFTLVIRSAKRNGIDGEDTGIAIFCTDIVEGVTVGEYPLKSRVSGNCAGRVLIAGGLTLNGASTDENPGKLVITRFDPEGERIVSGTFEFTGVDERVGRTLEITEGRFDIRL